MEPERMDGGQGSPASVFVVCDDRGCREALVSMLSAFHLTSLAFDSPAAFLNAYRPDRPGCLLLELTRGQEAETRVLEELRQQGIDLPVIIIAHAMNFRSVVRAMQLGALHVKEAPYDAQLLRTWIDRGIGADIVRRRKRQLQQTARTQLDSLTQDEHQVLEGILLGWHNKVIAARLDIGVRTVQARRAIILRKLDCQSVAELVWKVVVTRLDVDNEALWSKVMAAVSEAEPPLPRPFAPAVC